MRSTTGPSLRDIFRTTTTSDRFCWADAGADGGDAAAGVGAGDADAGAAQAAFYEGFADANLKTDPTIQTFKSVEELAKGHVALMKRFGIDPARRVDLPADPNDKDGMAAVFTKLGRPEKPDGYGFKLDDKASDADKAFLARALPALHGANLTTEQAKGVFEFWMKEAQDAAAGGAAAQQAAVAAGTEALRKEWGAAYEARTREIGALLVKHGDPALAAELDTPEKLGNHPALSRFLGKLLDQMAEPGVAGGGSGDAARGGERALTPAQAAAAVRQIEGDPVKGAALRDANHAMHKAVVEERIRLLAMTA